MDYVYVTETKGRSEITITKPRYEIRLTADKSEIVADGVDTATITAKVYNYLGIAQDDNIELTATVGEITDTYETVNGEVDIPFASNAEGDFVIAVSCSGYRSGEVVIHAGN